MGTADLHQRPPASDTDARGHLRGLTSPLPTITARYGTSLCRAITAVSSGLDGESKRWMTVADEPTGLRPWSTLSMNPRLPAQRTAPVTQSLRAGRLIATRRNDTFQLEPRM